MVIPIARQLLTLKLHLFCRIDLNENEGNYGLRRNRELTDHQGKL